MISLKSSSKLLSTSDVPAPEGLALATEEDFESINHKKHIYDPSCSLCSSSSATASAYKVSFEVQLAYFLEY